MVGRPARRPDRTTAVNSGRRRRRACAGNTSGGELLATLAPATGEDRPARAGAHPQPEAVGLGPTAVVRLERALAHEVLPLHDIDGAHPPVGGRARGDRRRTATCRAPATPEAGHCGRTRTAPTCTGVRRAGWRPEPSTDSSQHNRGTRGGRRPGGSRPPMVHPAAPGERGRRHAGRRRARSAVDRERCRAVDGAVSVAVAPRRTSGSRRVGRPRRSPDRRIARSPARTGLRPAEMPIGARAGAEPGSDPSPAVHSLWTPVWNAVRPRIHRVGHGSSDSRTGGTGAPGAGRRGRQHGEERTAWPMPRWTWRPSGTRSASGWRRACPLSRTRC